MQGYHNRLLRIDDPGAFVDLLKEEPSSLNKVEAVNFKKYIINKIDITTS